MPWVTVLGVTGVVKSNIGVGGEWYWSGTGVVSEWYWSGIGVKREEWKEVGEWSDKESRCLGSRMYLVGVCGIINMMCRDDIVQGVCTVQG
jgi:hypothetical protein